ncbi:MAG TPA: hypothetical protein DDZ66_09510, partial [Firmicutes bacterium]|nr:hypothetical protein [Bacillota bacterium]
MPDAISRIPLVLVLLPMVGALGVVGASKFRDHWRSRMINAITFATLVMALWQFYLVQQGKVLVYVLEGFMGFGLRWRVDHVSAIFSVVVAAVWFLATIFAREYI